MLRVIASRNAKEYFAQSLSKEDYYSEGQEVRGEWQGIGAERLGLSGPVTTEAFESLCDNQKPGTDERLTQRNKSNRIVGYDFNFHCPKSVSVVYELTRDERILDAFKDSVKQAMREVESEIKTRVRKNGADENRTTSKMVWAEFFHFTARPVNGVPDPHLHAHCYVFNTTWDDAEEKWKAGQFRDLKADAPYFEAAFHARFARQLADVGYRIERTAKGWELAGVPHRVLDVFSKRTEQVKQKAKELGITSARGKDGLAALTRERKQKQFSKAELRELWGERITADERTAIQNAAHNPTPETPAISESKAMDFAVQHCYERASIVTDKELLRQALRFGVGDVNVEQTKRQLLRGEFIAETAGGQQWLTTNQVLAEEKRLIDFAKDGKGKFNPFNSGAYHFQNEKLSDEQRKAVLHVLHSPDRVTAIRGGAGTGKTTMMKEAVAGIEAGGQRVFTFAPSAEASRGVLRSEGGFADAETVEALLQSQKLQEQVRGQVIWIDEAGLLGARALARVAALAGKENCRVILSGDTTQHRAVERGDALRILEKHAHLQAAELKEIWRQKADSHKAIVADLRAGNLERAFTRLDKLGMLRELASEERHEALAADYVDTVEQGKTALVISPTHIEGEHVTTRIRDRLKAAGKLHDEEREFLQLKNLQWTEAQRSDALNHQPDMVVQFHQNVPGFQRGERVKVKRRDGRAVEIERENGKTALLPLDKAARFQVYESRTIALTAGDMVRITQNGFTRDKQRLNNGDLKQVKGFTKEGDIKLANGWVISKDYGNLTHGYCVTSYASQSKSVDCVFVAESSESFRAADRQQFYVSVSRFKEALTIYTDDKSELLEAVSKSSMRPSATDLLQAEATLNDSCTAHPLRRIRHIRRWSGGETQPGRPGEAENQSAECAEAITATEPMKTDERTVGKVLKRPQTVRPSDGAERSHGVGI
ncbi:relaxase domain-containing protein [bacterium]|nr:relaxase domain-containing protein [bacterium]